MAISDDSSSCTCTGELFRNYYHEEIAQQIIAIQVRFCANLKVLKSIENKHRPGEHWRDPSWGETEEVKNHRGCRAENLEIAGAGGTRDEA